MNFPSKKTKGVDESKIERNSRLNKYNMNCAVKNELKKKHCLYDDLHKVNNFAFILLGLR